MERRDAKRLVRRLRVELVDLAAKTRIRGYTVNLSSSGALVACGSPLRVGSHVRARLSSRDNALAFEAIVTRVVHGRTNEEGRVGIRFVGRADVSVFLASGVTKLPSPPDGTAPAAAARSELHLSRADLFRRLEEEIRFGGLFVTSAERPPRDSRITISITLEGGGSCVAAGRVVHHTREGFAVELERRAEVIAAVQKLLSC
jgi:hypothetical protein